MFNTTLSPFCARKEILYSMVTGSGFFKYSDLFRKLVIENRDTRVSYLFLIYLLFFAKET